MRLLPQVLKEHAAELAAIVLIAATLYLLF